MLLSSEPTRRVVSGLTAGATAETHAPTRVVVDEQGTTKLLYRRVPTGRASGTESRRQ
jgi:hypothetical protein